MSWRDEIGLIKDRVLMVVREAFDETDLTGGVYTLTYANYGDVIGFGINNNSTENPLTVTIGSITIAVPKEKPFYAVFGVDTTIAIAGTSLDFDAFVEG